jgi:hypothetical protein
LLESLLQIYLQNISSSSNKNKELERLEILINDAVPEPPMYSSIEKEYRVKALMAIAKCGSFDLYIDSGGKDLLALSVLGKKLLNDGFEPYQISLSMNDWIGALGLDELGARFVKENAEETRDYLTGLTWKTYALGQSVNKPPTLFHTARSNEISEALANFPEWRLPREAELLSLIRCKRGYLGVTDGSPDEPAIHPEAFPNTDSRESYRASGSISGVSDGRYTSYNIVSFGSCSPGFSCFTNSSCFIRLVKR